MIFVSSTLFTVVTRGLKGGQVYFNSQRGAQPMVLVEVQQSPDLNSLSPFPLLVCGSPALRAVMPTLLLS